MRGSLGKATLLDGRSPGAQAVLPGALLAFLAFLLVGCTADHGADEPATVDEPATDFERVEVLAPIESAELEVRESAPPQYAVRVASGLPSGCAELERIDVERDGRDIDITVWNTVPADDAEVACTMIYRSIETTVELGNDFETGTSYAVRVNRDISLSFTAQ